MADLELLKKQRKIIKSALTRILTHCNQENATFESVRGRFERATDLFRQYNDIQDKIDETSPDNQQQEEGYREQVENTFYAIQTRHYQLQGDNSMRVNETAQHGNNDMMAAMQALVRNQNSMVTLMERFSENVQPENVSTPNENSSSSQNELKLPRIQLPNFDGNLLDWVRFRDLFEAMVHTRTSISNVEKLEYLHTKLTGEALLVIKQLKPTNHNYETAWTLLKQKFDNIEKIKNSYLELILDQHKMKSSTLAEVKRLHNNCNEGFNALKSIEQNAESMSSVLLYNVEKKLDTSTAEAWYKEKSGLEIATFQKLLDFLGRRIIELESAQAHTMHGSTEKFANRNQLRTHAALVQACPNCSEQDFLFQCAEFKNMTVGSRRSIVEKNNICFNCLKPNHRANECKLSACKICGRKHNTLLHVEGTHSPAVTTGQRASSSNQMVGSNISDYKQQQQTYVLLPTAIVLVQDVCGTFQACRALLDSGSQSTLISESCVQRLGLKREYSKTTFYGIGVGSANQAKGKVNIHIKGKNNPNIITTTSYCLSHVTQDLPHQQINDEKFSFFQGLSLADTTCCEPGKIELLLGADIFSECCLQDKITHPSGAPTALNTIFGWVLMGHTTSNVDHQLIACHTICNIDQQLRRFWEVEEVSAIGTHLSNEEQQTEDKYNKTTTRNDEGRYIVRLPLKEDMLNVGESNTIAVKRLHAVENRCKNNIEMQRQYVDFMNEYLSLGHMKLSSAANISKVCILPHHAVMKPSSTTTKLRVVFDASCKTTNGKSLNDNLLVGPQVQTELFDMIIKFRKHPVAFAGDIEKMYRQVIVHPDDQPMQRILWRNSDNEQIKQYDLTTGTYGTASAPFLAPRTLKQVAIDNMEHHPTASKAIEENFYVDDFMCSVTSVHAAISLKEEVCELLAASGFKLRKFSSNSTEFMKSIKHEDLTATSSDSPIVNVLGLNWNIKQDSFQFKIDDINNIQDVTTKRSVLSAIAKTFDPLGWVAPIVVQLKIFMQKLWLSGLNWDDVLTDELHVEWGKYRQSLQDLSKITIPRWSWHMQQQFIAELNIHQDKYKQH